MKKLIVIAALLGAGQLAQAQFEKFEDMDAVTTVVVNEGMFKMLSGIEVEMDDPEAREFKELVTQLKGIKVLTTEDPGIGKQMREVAMSYQSRNRLEELMSVKDKDANIKFYTRKGKDASHVGELLMIISDLNGVKAADRDVETVIVSIIGDIDLNKIGSLTKKMNLPSELNKVDNR